MNNKMTKVEQALFRNGYYHKTRYEQSARILGKWDEETIRRFEKWELLENVIGECGLEEEFKAYCEQIQN